MTPKALTTSTLALALACGLVAAPAAFAQDNYVDFFDGRGPLTKLEMQGPPLAPVNAAPEGGLTFFTDRPTFDLAAPGLPLEDFESALIGGGAVVNCGTLVSSAATPCFAAGDVLPGIEVSASGAPPDNDVVGLGAGVIGNTTVVVGANTFVQGTIVAFTGGNVDSVGMDLHSNAAGGEMVTLNIFDDGGVMIGSTMANATATGSFWGVTRGGGLIGRIEIVSPNGDLVDNVAFGSGAPSIAVTDVSGVDVCASEPANNNGIAEPGEVIEFTIEVTANAPFTGVTGTLTSLSPDAVVIGNATWPDLAAGVPTNSNGPFQVQILETATCFAMVDFSLDINANEGGPFNAVFSDDIGSVPMTLSTDTPVAIPDNLPAGASSTISIPDDVMITDLDVRVQIDHTWVGDLILTLTPPVGAPIVLLDRPGIPVPGGAGCADDNMNVTFDDDSVFDAEVHCPGSDPWYVGDAFPVDALSAVNGTSTMGDWTLTVTDNAGADTGNIVEWEMILTPALGTTCTICETAVPVIEVPTLDWRGLALLLLALAGAAIFVLRRRM